MNKTTPDLSIVKRLGGSDVANIGLFLNRQNDEEKYCIKRMATLNESRQFLYYLIKRDYSDQSIFDIRM